MTWPLVRVERDATMGWWWVEVLDEESSTRCGWVSASKALGLDEDTFGRRDRAESLKQRIEKSLGLVVAVTLARST